LADRYKKRNIDTRYDGQDERIAILHTLGLTPVQAKVYLHLLYANEQSARSVVDSLKLDRVDVYRALQRLQFMGMVEVNLGNPNKFDATPPSAALKLLLDNKNDEFETIKSQASHLNKLLSTVEKQNNPPNGAINSDQYYKLKRGYGVINSILDLEKEAKSELRKVVNRKGMGYHILFGISEVEKKLYDKGVKIRLITDQMATSQKSYSKIAQIRYAGDISNVLRYIVIDDKTIVVSMAPNTTDEKDSVALFTNNKTLIQALCNYFDEIWDSLKL
jgi:sugar-specific transcriptional regulator TrmB